MRSPFYFIHFDLAHFDFSYFLTILTSVQLKKTKEQQEKARHPDGYRAKAW
jgi:hypothetical protein